TPEPEITGSPPTQDTLVSSEVEESLSDETAVTTETPEEPESAVPANQYEVLMDQGMAWDECKAAAVPGLPAPSNDLIEIEADSATAFPEQDSAQFQGNVIIRHPNQTLYADDLHYDNRRQLIKADQQLLIQLRDLRLLGKQAWFDLNEYKGEMADVSYRIPSRKARGEAGKMALLDEDHSRFEGISYTTCPPGNRGFMLSADSMEIDQEKQIGIFKAARLRFLGVPVFYAPSLTVSLDDSRKSGLLVPSLGYSSKNGADITTPYYFNLAPNYDATIMPRLLSKRGLLLGGEFRFLTPRNDGLFFGEILPDDRESDKHGTRGAIHARTHSNLNFLTEGLSADVDINWVSDDDYLDDLGRSLAVTSTRHLLSRAALNWRLPEWDAIAEVRDYKTLDEGIAAEDHPYSLLPRLAVNWTRFQGAGGLDYSVGVEMTSFHRDDSVTGSRFDLRPRASLPLRNNWGFLEPALSGRYTIYELDDQVPGLDDKPDRATWSASLDGGLFFDRSVNWFGRDMTHTIEPRAFYLYTPHVNQDDLPLFDTGLLDYSFDNLFRDNRFNGPDRVGDANQLTLALTSRVLSGNNGRELLNASIGQIYYFEDRRVTLYDDDPTDTRSSSVIAELSTGIFDHWLMRAGVQVDPHAGTGIQQGLAQANYHGESGERFHASWRLREGVLEQTDLAAYWPVSEKISLIGRWYYSVEERQDLETVAGIEYGDCCWRVRAVWRRYLDSDGTEYNNTALLQLELNGLGKLGNDIDNFLDRTIYGY
ncbi:MAG TPA: LPS assembly protein LptD, partial [Chromatiaceae bacterium]|nr:LPS assembly protein LptD [Chromatiaceae bacterium]